MQKLSFSNRNAVICHSDDRREKKLPHRSCPQNPIIADALFMTAFLESWGTGVSRMVEACKAVGLPEPEYGTDGAFVWITFKRLNSVANSVTDSVTNSDINSDTLTLSDKQKEDAN